MENIVFVNPDITIAHKNVIDCGKYNKTMGFVRMHSDGSQKLITGHESERENVKFS